MAGGTVPGTGVAGGALPAGGVAGGKGPVWMKTHRMLLFFHRCDYGCYQTEKSPFSQDTQLG